jgi:hypothetical protein
MGPEDLQLRSIQIYSGERRAAASLTLPFMNAFGFTHLRTGEGMSYYTARVPESDFLYPLFSES